MGEFICFEQPDLFKPVQSVIAVLVLISLGSASAVDGSGVLWFIALSSLTISTLATILLMFNKDGMSGRNIHFADGILPWNVIEFVYSSILTLLCGIALWISFGYASHVDINGHSAGYVFAGIFLILQMACYAIPVFILYNRIQSAKEQHEPIAEVNPFGFRNGDEERYQNQTV